jgi:hypothetical protein
MNNKIYTASKENPYFVYEPDGEGFVYFGTEKERDEYAQYCIDQYLQDGWDDGVDGVVAGVMTHDVIKTNERKRPEKLDDNNCDEDGTCWHDWDYVCNYEMRDLST